MAIRFMRPSQFVTTYGAGSIVRIGHTARTIPSIDSIIADLEKWKSFNNQDRQGRRRQAKFRIEDTKLESMIKSKMSEIGSDADAAVSIFRLPSNADVEISEGTKLYNTNPFPRWSICKEHGEGVLARLEMSGWKTVLQCPLCIRENRQLGTGVGIRFVRACRNGHMDDVDWDYEVHMGSQCSGEAFSWNETDNDFEVRCLVCKKATSYRQIKGREKRNAIRCSGYLPESERHEGCTFSDGESHSRIVLRSASNLRVAHVLSSLMVPPHSDRLYQMLGPYLNLFVGRDKMSKGTVGKLLRTKGVNPQVTDEILSAVDDASEKEIMTAIGNLTGGKEQGPVDELGSDRHEFAELLKASKRGHPKSYAGEPSHFVVEKSKVRRVRSEGFDLEFVVTPISVLNVTQAQIGYSREVGDGSDHTEGSVIGPTARLVPTYHRDRQGTKWFVGSRMQGEGIFLHVDGGDVFGSRRGDAYKNWQKISSAQADERTSLMSSPSYVWWHSLGHRLVNDLAIDSGFQSAAIREKTYVRKKGNGSYEGGVLLYAVQQGGDGTLGGLTGMVGSFGSMLDRAWERFENCSNDPICLERHVNPGRSNGAACHACLITSETSCSVMNRFLDRRAVMGE